jgi:hypothetical protein
MIGVTVIAKDYVIATRDERSFPKISGLKITHCDWNPIVEPA